MAYKKYDQETLDKLHQTELGILDDFHKICEENNLRYFLTGGTMLGAIRHKGFIPWDDDIDVGMPRSDYDKFIKIAPKLLGDKYYLDCFEYNENYHLPFAKIRKNGTIFDEDVSHHVNNHKGIYIDIFAFENVSKEGFLLKLRAVMVRNILETMFYKYKMRKLKKTRRPYLVLLFSILTKKRLMKIQKYFLTLDKNDNSKYINAIGGSYNYLKENNLRDTILPPKKIKFEGKEYYGMNDPDTYLSKLFGDYMQLPPEDKRVNHMPLEIVFGDEKKTKKKGK